MHPRKALARSALAIALYLCPDSVVALQVFTPPEWQPHIENWAQDANHNYVSDDLDAIASSSPNARVAVWVALNRCPRDTLIARLDLRGEIRFIGDMVTAVAIDSVRAGDVAAIAQLEDPLDNTDFVSFVRSREQYAPLLVTSTRGIRYNPSATYSPNTVLDQYPGATGSGVNVAFIDTGIDDGTHAWLPGSKFVGGFTYRPIAFAFPLAFPFPVGIEENPDDQTGHGTLVASVAVGTTGVAPGAGLIDLKIVPLPASWLAPLLNDWMVALAIQRAIMRKDAWNIGVLNIGMGPTTCAPDNGRTNIVAQWANRAVRSGMVVVAPAGNTGTACIGGAGAADDAITVGAIADQGTITNDDDVVATFSTIGPRASDGDGDTEDEEKPDLVAPGSRFASLCVPAVACPNPPAPACGIVGAAFNTVADTCQLAGTSIAAAHVSGVAALLIQEAGLSPPEVKSALRTSTEDVVSLAAWNPSTGRGALNAFKALDQVLMRQADLSWSPWTGQDVPWESFAMRPTDTLNIIVGQSNPILCTIVNGGIANVDSFRVHVSVQRAGNHQHDTYDVGTITGPSLTVGQSVTLTMPWTPLDYHARKGHVCLYGEIITFHRDPFRANNIIQRNILIRPAASPAVFEVEIGNPTNKSLTVYVVPEVVLGSGWTASATPSSFPLSVGDCQQIVTLSLNPGVGRSARYRVRWRFIGSDGMTADTIGGVTTEGIWQGPSVPGWGLPTFLISVAAMMAAGAWALRTRRRTTGLHDG